jgi:hypothetical protein
MLSSLFMLGMLVGYSLFFLQHLLTKDRVVIVRLTTSLKVYSKQVVIEAFDRIHYFVAVCECIFIIKFEVFFNVYSPSAQTKLLLFEDRSQGNNLKK